MNKITKGDVWVGNDGWRVLVTNVTNKYVTFFAGYDTITEEIEMFINGYTKELLMKNEYSKDYDGLDRLTLNFDGSMEVEVTVEDKQVQMFKPDGYDSQFIAIYLEDWEQVKEFVDNQIKLLNKH